MKKAFLLIFLWGILAGCAGLVPAGEKSGDITGGDSGGSENSGIAKVNGVEISSSALSKTEGLIREQNLRTGRDLKDGEIRREAIDRLILQELIFQKARQLGIKAEEEKLDLYIEKMKESAGSDEAYREFLSREKVSEEDLRNEAERAILIQSLYDKEVSSGVVISEEEMRAEYEREKDNFVIPEKIVMDDVIFFLDPEDSSSIIKAEAVLKILRDERKDPSELKSDGSFAVRELANPVGIDLPLREEAMKLSEGQLSGVIKTGGNIHIIKLKTYSQKKQFGFDDVKQIIENNLKAGARKKRMVEWKSELKKDAKIEILMKGTGEK
ncbi:MAG: SurA N-terminal domain-containing protein [Thermodesulfovibrionales bacterium]